MRRQMRGHKGTVDPESASTTADIKKNGRGVFQPRPPLSPAILRRVSATARKNYLPPLTGLLDCRSVQRVA